MEWVKQEGKSGFDFKLGFQLVETQIQCGHPRPGAQNRGRKGTRERWRSRLLMELEVVSGARERKAWVGKDLLKAA